MPLLNNEELEKFIICPDLSRFNLNHDEQAQAETMIKKIKMAQCINLA